MPQQAAWTIRQKITGVLLRQARLDAGKTLKDCGEILGLSPSTVSSIEYGERGISLPELEILAFYLEIPIDQLLNGSAAPTDEPIDEIPNEELMVLRHRIIGALLRQARMSQDLTQAELAKAIGVSAARMSQYELGEKPVPLVELEALASQLDVPLSHFLDEGVGPVGKRQQLERDWQRFSNLPPDVRRFVLESTSLRYLELAMALSAVPADKLRNIAASLLEITL
jgi:transcriptional regulator with XRE-family HTH domain